MTQEEINKGNEIIARFMGGKSRKVIYCVFPSNTFAHPEHDFIFLNGDSTETGREVYTQWRFLRFHESLDWLMPVLVKIEGLGYEYIINGKHFGQFPKKHTTGIYFYLKRHGRLDCILKEGQTAVEATYKAVVEFIKWYNKQQNK